MNSVCKPIFRHRFIERHTIVSGNSLCLVAEFNGDGTFTEHVISKGTPTHEAKAADIGNTGKLSIVGKPYMPPEISRPLEKHHTIKHAKKPYWKKIIDSNF